MVSFGYDRIMPQLFDPNAKIHDIILSNVLLVAVCCILFFFWEVIVLSIAVLSPIWYRLMAAWMMFAHPVTQRSMWNRYG